MDNELKAFILGIDAVLNGSAPSAEVWAKVVAKAQPRINSQSGILPRNPIISSPALPPAIPYWTADGLQGS